MDNISNHPSKFRTKIWVEINDVSRGTCYTNSQIKFKTSILKLKLCNYNDEYILANGTTSATNTAATGSPANNINKQVFRN